jgi:hypothetical protein
MVVAHQRACRRRNAMQLAEVSPLRAQPCRNDAAWHSATVLWANRDLLIFSISPQLRDGVGLTIPQAYVGGPNWAVMEARLRTAVYRATINAARFNPIIKTFYERLRAAFARRAKWHAVRPHASS